MTRQARLDLLRALVGRHDYRTQADLIEALATHNVHVTQSSISRDIRALQLSKVDGVYTLPLKPLPVVMPPLDDPIWHHILTLHCVGGHLIVLRVKAATAQLIGAALDALPLPGIAGTIAGDDTVFIALKDTVYQQALATQLRITTGLTP